MKYCILSESGAQDYNLTLVLTFCNCLKSLYLECLTLPPKKCSKNTNHNAIQELWFQNKVNTEKNEKRWKETNSVALFLWHFSNPVILHSFTFTCGCLGCGCKYKYTYCQKALMYLRSYGLYMLSICTYIHFQVFM